MKINYHKLSIINNNIINVVIDNKAFKYKFIDTKELPYKSQKYDKIKSYKIINSKNNKKLLI